MRYSYEYKRMCVELYQQGKWPETPTGISEHILRVTIQKWACMDPFAAGRISDFSGWFCGAIRFFAQIAFFRGLNASELSHKVHFPCCTRTDTPPNNSDFLPILCKLLQEIQNKLETVLTEC